MIILFIVREYITTTYFRHKAKSEGRLPIFFNHPSPSKNDESNQTSRGFDRMGPSESNFLNGIPMTQTTLGKFVLESRHLYDGLSAEDIEAYTGVPSALFYLSDFSHWSALCQNGTLPPDALHERYLDIKKVVIATKRKHLRQWGPEIAGSDFLKEDVDQSPCLFVEPIKVLPPEICSISNLAAQWPIPNRNVTLPRTHVLGRLCAFAPVGSYDADDTAQTTGTKPWALSLSNIALVPHFYEPTDRYWNLLLGLPEIFIQRYPDQALTHLLIALHELRHGPQAHKSNALTIHRLSVELDADIFALNTLAENGLGDELRYVYPKTRYMSFLSVEEGVEATLYAPVLEAYLERRQPPRFHELVEARDAFHERLLTLSGYKTTQEGVMTADEKYAAKFFLFQAFEENPEHGYQRLNQWVEEKAFADKPLVNQIAQGIIGAVQFFSPRLLTQRAYTLRFNTANARP